MERISFASEKNYCLTRKRYAQFLSDLFLCFSLLPHIKGIFRHTLPCCVIHHYSRQTVLTEDSRCRVYNLKHSDKQLHLTFDTTGMFSDHASSRPDFDINRFVRSPRPSE